MKENHSKGIIKEKERMERSYWIGAILTEDWNKNNDILKLSVKIRTREILISKPVYQPVYKRKVRYISVSFFKAVSFSYFGREFYLENDIVPVMRSVSWKQENKYVFDKLIRDLGKPDFYYSAGKFKYACNNYKI